MAAGSSSVSAVQTVVDGVKLTIRPARVEDLKQINEFLAADVHWDIGVHILELYYRNSKRRWPIAVDEEGKVIALDIANVLPLKEEVVFGFNTLVNKNYRRKNMLGLLQALFHGRIPFMGNATAAAMLKYPVLGKFVNILMEFNGQPDFSSLDSGFGQETEFWKLERKRSTGGPWEPGGRMMPRGHSGTNAQNIWTPEHHATRVFEFSILASEGDMQQVVSYDRTILDLDRAQFTRAWCAQSKRAEPYARTLVARNVPNGAMVGFGTVRKFSHYYYMGPLYADDQIVAKQLLIEMMKLFKKDCRDQQLRVFIDTTNRLMMEFVHSLKLKPLLSLTRHYANGAQVFVERIRFERVYALHEYWPV